MDDTVVGCCGFKIRFLLQDKKYNGEETHLEVRELKLPPTSHHRLISTQARQVALATLMKIDGLGAASLLEYLAPVASAAATAAGNREDGDEGGEDSIEETTPKIQVPQSKVRRYNEANALTRQIRKCTIW